jgi:hypothetical protein
MQSFSPSAKIEPETIFLFPTSIKQFAMARTAIVHTGFIEK